jgi:NADH-quinone oxidoreductase F subunit
MFTQEEKKGLDQVVAQYERKQAALLPVLAACQKKQGLITLEAMKWSAQYLEIPLIKVEEVVSFYTLFRTHEVGKVHLSVCRNLTCTLKGANEIIDTLRHHPGLGKGFTYETAECLGACEHAPVVLSNNYYVGSVKAENVDALLSVQSENLPLKVFGPKDASKRILTTHWEIPESHTLEFYWKHSGYQGLKKAREMEPKKVTDEVIASNLRGLGGAGFPCGRKWSFIPKTDKPVYLVVNADEGEPGTFKDRLLMERSPHQLLEGIGICCHANGVRKAFLYIRGEYEKSYLAMRQALDEAKKAGLLDIEVVLHRGAGAYICGEETGLLESLEGKKGFPRLKPPFPAIEGLFGCPTVINNVETLSHLPHIIRNGAKWFSDIGCKRNGGTRLFCVSGCVKQPGVYELPLGTPLREIIYDYAGGIPENRALKAVIPGGASAPILTAQEIDVGMDFDSLAKAGTMGGSGGVMVLDESVDIVKALSVISRFFAHESCGQCSPCREGTGWVSNIIDRVLRGKGRSEDPDRLISIVNNVQGNTICALGDAMAMPVRSYVTKFREEFEAHIDAPEQARRHFQKQSNEATSSEMGLLRPTSSDS